jgi:hypothetical protein
MGSDPHTEKQRAISSYVDYDSAPDTDPHSSFWQGAPGIFMARDGYGNDVPGHRTEVRSRWTSRNLYFLFLCPYEQLHLRPDPILDAKTDGLWNWDVAETFIGSPHGPIHKYKEFELSPQGEWLDLDIDLEKPGKVANHSWSSGFQVAARIEEKIWYGCMRIPYVSIDQGEAKAGNSLRINFFRSQGPKPLEIAWRPPLQASFHAPEQFGVIELV